MDKQKNIPNRPSLGKGLASLIPAAAVIPEPELKEEIKLEGDNRDRHMGISMCGIDEIMPNAFQPRKSFDDATIEELSQSIRANGLIQPLIVRKMPKGYQLIAGERRLRAAKQAGLTHVPIVIRRTTDKEALELAIIENIQREDLNCIDTALAYYQLIQDFDLKQDEISDRVGKDRASVANYLRLLKLPLKVQNDLRAGELSFGHGKALLGLDNPETVEKLALQAIEKKWSVRELENHVQMLKNLAAGREANTGKEDENLTPLELRIKNIGRDLSAKFATKVQLRGDGERGKIVIEYFTRDDLERVLEQMMK